MREMYRKDKGCKWLWISPSSILRLWDNQKVQLNKSERGKFAKGPDDSQVCFEEEERVV